jgi:PAS domain-containing protein
MERWLVMSGSRAKSVVPDNSLTPFCGSKGSAVKSGQESATHEDARHLQAIFDAIPSPTFIVDADVRIQDFNLAANQLLWPQPQGELVWTASSATTSPQPWQA